ncbi:MAG: two-component system, cell cycle response regulator [Actinomycetota bacterium]|jgi:two-component system cell cycle response regulator|nr:two-component system, cell cycle response regulator [Actinomycetota bacterium]
MGRTMRPPPPFTRSLAVALAVAAGWLLVVAVIAVAAGNLVGIAVLAAVGAVMAAACGLATWRSARRVEAWLGEQLHGTARDLETSQQAFRRAIARLGETLAATHDREKILEAVSETAQLAVGAQRGIFYEYIPARKVLLARSGVGPDAPELTLPLGTGLAGASAEGRSPLRYPGTAAAPVFPEPEVGTAMAVPFSSRGQLLGVVAVYGHTTGGTFGDDDVEALVTLVAQAGTAVDNVSLHEEARRLSITDGLTGLWNRRQLDLRCQEELERAIRFGRPIGVVFCDVDLFKNVNTEWQHLGGDAVLVEVAQRLSAATREIDVVARYGGEEFVLLLPETDLAGARILAEKVRRAMCEEPVEHNGKTRTVTLSLGVASYPHSGTSVRTLLAGAQEALKRAKENGRNRIEEAHPMMRSTG